jgi:hypothetical protein
MNTPEERKPTEGRKQERERQRLTFLPLLGIPKEAATLPVKDLPGFQRWKSLSEEERQYLALALAYAQLKSSHSIEARLENIIGLGVHLEAQFSEAAEDIGFISDDIDFFRKTATEQMEQMAQRHAEAPSDPDGAAPTLDAVEDNNDE